MFALVGLPKGERDANGRKPDVGFLANLAFVSVGEADGRRWPRFSVFKANFVMCRGNGEVTGAEGGVLLHLGEKDVVWGRFLYRG